MTVEECATSILEQVAPLVLVNRTDGERQEGYTATIEMLRTLIYRETQRCIIVVREWRDPTGCRYSQITNRIADEILRTSPGKQAG